MTKDEIEEVKLQIECERLEIEREQSKNEQQFVNKHYTVCIWLAQGIFVFFFLLFLSVSSYAQMSSAASQEFRTLLMEIKKAVNDQNKALALELLSKASRKLEELEERPIIEEEAIRWNMAQLNLDRAESMKNHEQIAFFANESIQRWLEYIEWYRKLDPKQQELIRARPDSDRIQRAVRQLGNAYMRRENIPPYTIRDLFATYRDLPVEYFSSQSVELWKSWLFRCPKWEQVNNPSFQGLKSRFAKKDEDTCRDDWTDFKSFLEGWLEKQSLASDKKRNYNRWLADLSNALDQKETHETSN